MSHFKNNRNSNAQKTGVVQSSKKLLTDEEELRARAHSFKNSRVVAADDSKSTGNHQRFNSHHYKQDQTKLSFVQNKTNNSGLAHTTKNSSKFRVKKSKAGQKLSE